MCPLRLEQSPLAGQARGRDSQRPIGHVELRNSSRQLSGRVEPGDPHWNSTRSKDERPELILGAAWPLCYSVSRRGFGRRRQPGCRRRACTGEVVLLPSSDVESRPFQQLRFCQGRCLPLGEASTTGVGESWSPPGLSDLLLRTPPALTPRQGTTPRLRQRVLMMRRMPEAWSLPSEPSSARGPQELDFRR